MSVSHVIRVSHLTKTFKQIKALDDVSFEVNKGDVYGILGPNGAGKTTAISAILSLVTPDSGSIDVLGEKITSLSNFKLNKVGALIGDTPPYFPYMSGRENIEFIAKYHRIAFSRVDDMLKFFGLKDAADRKPTLYSTGMKQRLGLAMALVHKPEILVLDEPTNGMDPTGMKEIRLLIKQLSQHGITIVLSSHLLHEVEQLCNRIVFFNHGKVITQGDLDKMRFSHKLCVETKHTKKSLELLQAMTNKSVMVESDQTIIVENGDPETIIELLVRNMVTPSQVYKKKTDLEELYMSATKG